MKPSGKIGSNGVYVSDNVERRFEIDIHTYIYKPDGSSDVMPRVRVTVDVISSENPPNPAGGCERLHSHPLKGIAGIIPQVA